MTPRARRLLQLGIALVIALVGIGGYFLFIPTTTIQSTKLAEFVVSSPKITGISPSPSNSSAVLLTHDPSAAVVAAAKADPAHTGAFTRSWYANSKSGASVNVTLEIVPTAGLAHQVFLEEEKQGLSASGLTSSSYRLTSRFDIPSIPGSVAASYEILHPPTSNVAGTKNTTLAPTPAITVIFGRGNVVVAVQVASYHLKKSEVVAFAKAEYALATATVPTFTSLYVTAGPPAASALWASVAFVFFVSLVSLPWALERAEISRRKRDEQRASYAIRSRGSKVARRGRVDVRGAGQRRT